MGTEGGIWVLTVIWAILSLSDGGIHSFLPPACFHPLTQRQEVLCPKLVQARWPTGSGPSLFLVFMVTCPGYLSFSHLGLLGASDPLKPQYIYMPQRVPEVLKWLGVLRDMVGL